MRATLNLPLWCLLMAGCSAPLLSEALPGTGYVDLELDLADRGVDASQVTDVLVGGIRAYDLRREDQVLTITVQGGPPGEADVVVRTADGETTLGAITYEGPIDPIFDQMNFL